MTAQILLDNGPAGFRANRARYDMEQRPGRRDRPDPVHRRRRLSAGHPRRDRRTCASAPLASRGPVDGQMPLGRFSADRLRGRTCPTGRSCLTAAPACISSRGASDSADESPRSRHSARLAALARGRARHGPVRRSRATTPTRRSTSPPTGSRCRTAPTARSSRAMSSRGRAISSSAARGSPSSMPARPAASRSSGSRRAAASPCAARPKRARSQFAIYDLDRRHRDDDRRRHPDPRQSTSRAAGWCSISTAAAR